MTEQELQELALKLAREAIVKTHDSSFYVSPTVIEMVRAAVAHGLRMGAEMCKEVPGLHACDRALIRMADDIEAAK